MEIEDKIELQRQTPSQHLEQLTLLSELITRINASLNLDTG